MKVKVQSLDAKAGGDIELNDEIFAVEPRADILHRVVTWQLINRRAPARAARERSDVARTGKKFGRQKGGGTARHGDRRAPIFVGGGKAHGPRVRDFNPSLNKKVRALGLKMALSAKAKGGNLIVLDNLDLKEAKTAALKSQIEKNSKQIGELHDVLGKNLDLVRAAGFGLLDMSSSITKVETAEQLAGELRRRIEKDAPAALSQAANLDPIAVAVLALTSGSSSTSTTKSSS